MDTISGQSPIVDGAPPPIPPPQRLAHKFDPAPLTRGGEWPRCIGSWNSFITVLPSLLLMGYFIMLDGKRFPDKIWSGQKTSEFLHSLWKIHLLLVHLCTVYFILKILLEGGRCTGWRLLELHRVGVFV